MIGFIGQGWIGSNMADDFEERGFEVVRYSLEAPYIDNKDKIKECDVTFIAVPTPSTNDGFSLDYVRSALDNIGDGKIAVIKSTILPGSTAKLQSEYPKIVVMHSPEFLREKHAAEDTRHPSRNILGVLDYVTQGLIDKVMNILPYSVQNIVMSAESAECVKYGANNFLYTKIVFFNIMYDFVQKFGGTWTDVVAGIGADPRIGTGHTNVFDKSGEQTTLGRGAGGHCFIKDFEAMLEFAEGSLDESQLAVLRALRHENNKLLTETNKDIDLLRGVYGENIK